MIKHFFFFWFFFISKIHRASRTKRGYKWRTSVPTSCSNKVSPCIFVVVVGKSSPGPRRRSSTIQCEEERWKKKDILKNPLYRTGRLRYFKIPTFTRLRKLYPPPFKKSISSLINSIGVFENLCNVRNEPPLISVNLSVSMIFRLISLFCVHSTKYPPKFLFKRESCYVPLIHGFLPFPQDTLYVVFFFFRLYLCI